MKAFSAALEIAVMFWGDGSGLILGELHKAHEPPLYLVFDTQDPRNLPNLFEVKTICEDGGFQMTQLDQ